jgi:uncharacterized protein (DUF1499 family)
MRLCYTGSAIDDASDSGVEFTLDPDGALEVRGGSRIARSVQGIDLRTLEDLRAEAETELEVAAKGGPRD